MNTYPTKRRLLRTFSALRNHLRHTQAEWGDAIGRDAVAISRIENGKAPLHAQYLLLIAEHHGFPVWHFFCFDLDTGQISMPPDPEKEYLQQENAALRQRLAQQDELVERMRKELRRGGGRKIGIQTAVR